MIWLLTHNTTTKQMQILSQITSLRVEDTKRLKPFGSVSKNNTSHIITIESATTTL